jgi:hypothetical protein
VGTTGRHEEEVRQLERLEKSCMACHQSAHTVAMEHWKPLHDEVARLWQELAPGRKAPTPATADELQAAHEAVELLQAQVRVKRAELNAVRVSVDVAAKRRGRVKALAATNAVGAGEMEEAEAEVARQHARLDIREAELQEAQIRLRQAERRLAGLQKSSKPDDAKKPSSQEERLLQLEGDLKKLLDQVRALERERNRTPPRDQRP